jgi:predicted lipid-binding transport protein (Tim44 family)
MKRLFLTFCALVLSVGLGVSSAEAKRLGGGKSAGMQRESVSQPAPSAPAATAAAPTAGAGATAAAQPRRNSWLGPVAGLAAGLGLAALASHLGFGEEFGNIMLIALLVMGAFLVFRLLTRRRAQAPAMQYAGAGGGFPPNYGQGPGHGQPAPQSAMPSGMVTAAPRYPAGFDAEAFVRQAKVNFLRLQAANDAGNLDDLRDFTTPEMFAELQMDLRERGASPQHTEVMDLHAEALECVEEGNRYVVSVRFHGLIREEAGAPPVDFDEVWHLVKPVQGDRGWAVAGIQQRT